MREENIYDSDSSRPVMDGGEIIKIVGFQEESIELGGRLGTVGEYIKYIPGEPYPSISQL